MAGHEIKWKVRFDCCFAHSTLAFDLITSCDPAYFIENDPRSVLCPISLQCCDHLRENSEQWSSVKTSPYLCHGSAFSVIVGPLTLTCTQAHRTLVFFVLSPGLATALHPKCKFVSNTPNWNEIKECAVKQCPHSFLMQMPSLRQQPEGYETQEHCKGKRNLIMDHANHFSIFHFLCADWP